MSAVPSASPVPAVVGTIALATTTLTTIGAALLGTPYELGARPDDEQRHVRQQVRDE